MVETFDLAPRIVPLSQGYWAIVDAEDYERLAQSKWCIKKGGSGGDPYAARTVRYGKHFITLRLHRVIMQEELNAIPDKREVDHINHNTLDNRKRNLRVVTKKENLANRDFPQKANVPF